MSDYDPLVGVDQAQGRLSALRGRLELYDVEPDAPDLRGSVADLLEALAKLAAHYTMLREILARTSDAVFAKDLEGRYVMINREGARMFGKLVAEVLGRDDTELFEPESAARIMAIDREVLDTGLPRAFEGSFRRLGQDPVTLLTNQAAWHGPRGELRGLIGTSQDVTERRRSEHGTELRQQRLRSLAAEIVIAEERLRQSLAADLHSGLGQQIALAKLELEELRSSAQADLRETIGRIASLAEQADRSLRSITYQLSPPSLRDLGLVPALRWLAEDFGSRFALAVRIELEAPIDVSNERLRLMLFRAVRELLVNVAAHAGVGAAVVSLAGDPRHLRLCVEDRGAGFDPSQIHLHGYGLFGVREQLEHAGGSMQVDSAPGRGTRVTLSVPLEASSA